MQLATIKALAGYWTDEYDWRKCEAKLNALPQFKTEIDGVEIHFIHVRSEHEGALPLVMTHGWPGSVIELLESIGPLTDPTAHGGQAGDAFDLVLPSLPGYGFSAEPTEIGWDVGRIGKAWAELMRRLGYDRYVAQGGDVGSAVTDAMGRQAPDGLVGIHINLLRGVLAGGDMPVETEKEQAAQKAVETFRSTGFGYFLEQSTRPQTVGYATLDSPVALAAWMLDHDTDSYYKISRAFLDGEPAGNLTREHIVDNVTTYWLTGTGASAAGRIGRTDVPRLPQPRRARGLRRSRSRSPSRRSRARSSRCRGAGSRSSIPVSRTSTRSIAAGISPPGRSRSCSRRRCERRSARCADPQIEGGSNECR